MSRWSRLKQEARAAAAPQPAGDRAGEVPELPVLPALDSLDFNSDFTGFLHPAVDEKIRSAALKKLFSDPHFNVMDGLDVYIDDYSRADPIPPAMLEQLARNLIGAREPDSVKRDESPARGSRTAVADGDKGQAPLPDNAAAGEPPVMPACDRNEPAAKS